MAAPGYHRVPLPIRNEEYGLDPAELRACFSPATLKAGRSSCTPRRNRKRRLAGELVRQFLGRPYGFASWQRWLEGGAGGPP